MVYFQWYNWTMLSYPVGYVQLIYEYYYVPEMVNPIWYKKDVCQIRLIPMRLYWRKKKTFLLCIFEQSEENKSFLESFD